MLFAAGVFFALIPILFAVNSANVLKQNELFCIENGRELLHAFVQTLKIFGVEENFVALYVVPFKAFLFQVVEQEILMLGFVYFYISFLCAAAPVTTGVFLFEILTSVFPKVKLTIYSLFKDTYYFNELNEFSLVFAESILKNKGVSKSPLIVFCDVYNIAIAWCFMVL